MAKLVTSDVTNFQNEQTAAGTINSNSAAIKLAMENTLSRDGTSPNQMTSQLDMNSFRIINLPAPQASGDPLRQGDVSLTGVVGYTAGTGITISGLVISTSSAVSGDDSLFTFFNHSDISKIAKFSCASITTATTRTFTFPDATTTLIGTDNTATLTNKTFDTAGTGNVLKVNGTGVTAVTGTGSVVLAVSPALTGTPTAPTAANRTSTTQVATTAFVTTQTRELLTASRAYFVRTDGSDSNNGLANTSGGAFLTLQKAYNTIVNTLDTGGQSVTVNIADGTYTAGITMSFPWSGGGQIVFTGNASTPDNVFINALGNYAFFNAGIPLPSVFSINNMKISSSTNDCIRNQGSGIIQFSNCTFGSAGGIHVAATSAGAIIQASSGYRIVDNAAGGVHAYCQSQAQVFLRGIPITIGPKKLTCSAGFAFSTVLSNEQFNTTTFVGAQTVTMTIASPAVVTWAAHGLVAGDVVVFNNTGGALPTGVTAGTSYFVIAAGLATNTFEFSTTSGGAAVNTSGSQSGVHNAFGAVGPRYNVDTNSLVGVGGAGATFLPGNSVGTSASGGVYG